MPQDPFDDIVRGYDQQLAPPKLKPAKSAKKPSFDDLVKDVDGQPGSVSSFDKFQYPKNPRVGQTVPLRGGIKMTYTGGTKEPPTLSDAQMGWTGEETDAQGRPTGRMVHHKPKAATGHFQSPIDLRLNAPNEAQKAFDRAAEAVKPAPIAPKPELRTKQTLGQMKQRARNLPPTTQEDILRNPITPEERKASSEQFLTEQALDKQRQQAAAKAKLEEEASRASQSTLGKMGTRFARGAVRGVTQTPFEFVQMANPDPVVRQTMGRIADDSKEWQSQNLPVDNRNPATLNVFKPEFYSLENVGKAATENIPEVLGEMLPQIALARGAGGIARLAAPELAAATVPRMASTTGAQLAARTAAGGYGAAQQSTQAYQKAIAAGMTHEQAQRAAAIEAPIGFSEFLGSPGTTGFTRPGTAVRREMREEGLQELSQTAASGLAGKYASGYDANKPLTDIAGESIGSGLLGAATGGIVATPGARLQARQQASQQRATRSAIDQRSAANAAAIAPQPVAAQPVTEPLTEPMAAQPQPSAPVTPQVQPQGFPRLPEPEGFNARRAKLLGMPTPAEVGINEQVAAAAQLLDSTNEGDQRQGRRMMNQALMNLRKAEGYLAEAALPADAERPFTAVRDAIEARLKPAPKVKVEVATPTAANALRAEADAAKIKAAGFEQVGDFTQAAATYQAAHQNLKRLRRSMGQPKTPEAVAQISQIDREISIADANRRKAMQAARTAQRQRQANAPTAGLPQNPQSAIRNPQSTEAPLLRPEAVQNPEGGIPQMPEQTFSGRLDQGIRKQAAQKPSAPAKRLISRIQELGGISNRYGGELQGVKDARRIGIVRNKAEMSPDILARQLQSEGYDIDPENLDTLWRAIDRDVANKNERPANTNDLNQRLKDEEAEYYAQQEEVARRDVKQSFSFTDASSYKERNIDGDLVDVPFNEGDGAWTVEDSLGGKARGELVNGVADIVGMQSIPQSKKYTSEASSFKRRGFFRSLIQTLQANGAKSIRIDMQSSDTKAAIQRLLQTGELVNPREIRGSSTAEHPTLFDIPLSTTDFSRQDSEPTKSFDQIDEEVRVEFKPDTADLREVREFAKREPRSEQFTDEPPTAPLARRRAEPQEAPEVTAMREREALPPIERREAKRQAVPKGMFGKLSESSYKGRPNALVENPQVRRLLGLGEMPVYRLPDAPINPKTGEPYVNPEWTIEAQNTLNALAGLAGKERSSQVDFSEGARHGVTGKPTRSEFGELFGAVSRLARRKGEPIDPNLRLAFEETGTRARSAQAGWQEFTVDERTENIRQSLYDTFRQGKLDRATDKALRDSFQSIATEYGLSDNQSADLYRQTREEARRRAERAGSEPGRSAQTESSVAERGERVSGNRGRGEPATPKPAAKTGKNTGFRAAVRDVTPEGYGPGESTSESRAEYDYNQTVTPDEQKIKNSIREGEMLLKGSISPEKRAQIKRSIESSKAKLAALQGKTDAQFGKRTPAKSASEIDREISKATPRRNDKAYNEPPAARPAKSIDAQIKDIRDLQKFGLIDDKEAKQKIAALEAQRPKIAERREAQPRTREDVENSPEFKRWFGDSQVVDESGKPVVVYHGTQSPTEISELDYSKLDPNALYGPGFYTTQDPNVAASEDGGYAMNKGNSPSNAHAYKLYLRITNPLDINGYYFPKDIPAKLKKILPNSDRVMSGQNIYESLVKEYGSKAEVNILLQLAGFDGITHLGGANNDRFAPRFKTFEDAKKAEGKRGGKAVALVPGNDFDKSLPKNVPQILSDDVDSIEYVVSGHRVWIAFYPEQIKSAIGNRGTFDPASAKITERRSEAMPERYTGRQLFENAQLTFRPARNRPATLVANDWGGAMLNRLLSEKLNVTTTDANFTIGAKDAKDLRDYLADAKDSGIYEPAQVANMDAMLKQMDAAIADAEANQQDVAFVTRRPAEPISATKAKIRHEAAHLSQSRIVADLSALTGKNWLDSQPNAKDIHKELDRRGYAPETHDYEAAAFVTSGDYGVFGMNLDQAAKFLSDYFGAVVEKHGKRALRKFGAIDPKLQPTLEAQRETEAGRTENQRRSSEAAQRNERRIGAASETGGSRASVLARRQESDTGDAGTPATGETGRRTRASVENSPEFKRWFGDSKVVDKDGKPLVMYHGTDVDFESFDASPDRRRFPYTIGLHFTTSPEEASVYASGVRAAAYNYKKNESPGANVRPVYIQAQRPLTITTSELTASMEADLNRAEIISQLVNAKRAGNPYDSVIIKRERGDEYDGWNVIAFSPNQIKSATGNRGTFDPTSPKITERKDSGLSPARRGQVLASGLGAFQNLFERDAKPKEVKPTRPVPLPRNFNLADWSQRLYRDAMAAGLPKDARAKYDAAKTVREKNVILMESKLDSARESQIFDLIDRAQAAAEKNDGSALYDVLSDATDLMRKTPERGLKRVGQEVGNLVSLPRAIMASADVSAPLRQGAILTLPPTQWGSAAKATLRMFQSFSTAKYKQIGKQINLHEDAETARESGLYLSTDKSGLLTKKEEDFISGWADKIPLVKHSEQAYKTYLDSLRMDSFARYKKSIDKTKGLSEEQKQKAYQAAAEWINTATGRGSLGSHFESAMPTLSKVLFAPRYAASRIQVLNPYTYAKNARTPEGRAVLKNQMSDMVQYAGMVSLTLALASAAGATVGLDPEDPDFLKIKVGQTRYDVLAGLQQPMRLFYRLGAAVSDRLKGEKPERNQSVGDISKKFVRSKLAPVPSFLWDYFEAKDFIGRDFEMKRAVLDRVVPLMWKDMADAYEKEGGAGAVKILPAAFGIGVQNYAEKTGSLKESQFTDAAEKYGKAYDFVRPKVGEPEAVYKQRVQRVEGWMSEYGDKLLSHPRYGTLTEAQQEAAIENLRRRIGTQQNATRPRLDSFAPEKVIQSVLKSEATRPKREAGKLWSPPK